MNAGYSSGWCEESFGMPLVAVEVECQARGDAHCRFVMAPPSRIEEHIAAYRGQPGAGPVHSRADADIRVPEFFQRKRMEDQIRASHEELRAARVETHLRTRGLQPASKRPSAIARPWRNSSAKPRRWRASAASPAG